MKTQIMNALILILFFAACKKDSTEGVSLKESQLTIGDHQLTYYYSTTGANTLIVFESGLGDDASPWRAKNIIPETVKYADVLLYDRGGYKKSTAGSTIRDISRLSTELKNVINTVAGSKKVILVAHSLGALIIRDYAIRNPSKTSALLFVDPTHEQYNLPLMTQSLEDSIYSTFLQYYGASYGGTVESRQLREDLQYSAGLPPLPNVPVTVLTSMRTDATHSTQDRQNWYNAHEQLKTGITNFVHRGVTNAGHYIQKEQPQVVLEELKKLFEKTR